MGCGCTHGSATMFKVPSGEGTDCAGGFGAGASWAHDVPAHASTIGRAVPAKIRKRVSVFTVEHEAYHCFLLLCFRLIPHPQLPRGSPPRRATQLGAHRPIVSGRPTCAAKCNVVWIPTSEMPYSKSKHG